MFKAKLTQTGNIEHWVETIAFLHDKVKDQLRSIAYQAVLDMGQRIEGDRKRSRTPTNKPHLSELITAEELINTRDMYSIGVGNIKAIEQMHRDPNFSRDTGQGWKLLNWGGLPGGGTSPRGYFSDGMPKAGGAGARFIYDPRSNARMKPKKPVQGIHFIENAASAAVVKLNIMLGGLMR